MKQLFSTAFILTILLIITPAFTQDVCTVRDNHDNVGSGFYLSETEVITAYHVVVAAQLLRVECNNQYQRATVVVIDKSSDLAILKLEKPMDVLIAELGDSATIYSDVEFHGHSFGLWDTVTRKGKVVVITHGEKVHDFRINTPAFPGDSGCPVVREGKVLGVIKEQIMDTEGPIAATATDVSRLKKLIQSLREPTRINLD